MTPSESNKRLKNKKEIKHFQMKNKLDFPFFTISEIDNRIVHIRMKEMEELRVEDVAQIYDVIEKTYGGKKVGILTTFDGPISSSQKEIARYALSERAQKLVLATAYLVDSLAMRMMIRFFLNPEFDTTPPKTA